MFDLNRLTRVRVLVAGDAMLDRYWFGGVQRISPEAPVPVVAVRTREERAGGAANVALNVGQLGAACTLLSVTGEDDAGRSLRRIVEQAGIDCRIAGDPRIDTTVKLRVLARNQQLLRVDFEQPPGEDVVARARADYEAALAGCDAVILSDYGKGTLGDVAEMISAARGNGVPVMVDPKGMDYDRYRGAVMLTPNRREFEQQVGVCRNGEELAERAWRLLGSLEVERLLITRSAEGMSLFGADGSVFHSPAQAREVYDVTGAGDTAIAVMTVALAAGADGPQALRIANVAAGIVVVKLGTATTTLEEIRQGLASEEPNA